VDLVGHDGGQAVGDFNWTLTVTDRSTGWTEAGAVRTKAEIYVVAALESCLRRYPGKVISLHADNGSEFMNGHLVRFCRALGITLTPEPSCPIPRGCSCIRGVYSEGRPSYWTNILGALDKSARGHLGQKCSGASWTKGCEGQKGSGEWQTNCLYSALTMSSVATLM